MFFRRVELDQDVYICKYRKNCYAGETVMNFRSQKFLTFESDSNPCLMDLIDRQAKVKFYESKNHCWNGQGFSSYEYTFRGVFTTVQFFVNIDFMNALELNDKVTLLRSFTLKSSLLASAMRAFGQRSDRLVRPDGTDVYPGALYRMPQFSHNFLRRIKSLLVARIIELNLTDEEYVLLNVTTAVSTLSLNDQSVIGNQQKLFNDALLKFCFSKYQNGAPSRFAELLSLCHVIQLNFEDVHYLTLLFNFNFS